MSLYWRHKLGFPCVRVSKAFWTPTGLKARGYHGEIGDLILYLDCDRRGNEFHFHIVNLETGEESRPHCRGWKVEDYLAECSMPLEGG